MFQHPDIHLELARQRRQELIAAAERRRVAKSSADRNAAAERSGASSGDAVEASHALTAADHFGHRESDDVVVDLFWSRSVGHEFRVEVEDRRKHARFVLCPTTGAEAIEAFYHPFAFARAVLNDEAGVA